MEYDTTIPKMPTREQNSHKGTFGKVLNICGTENYIGAAYLATASSLKVGAGFSALCSTQSVIQSVSYKLPEAVYIDRKEVSKQIDNFTTYLIGCGLGQSKDSIKLFEKVINSLKDTQKPVVIDADGLNILSCKQDISLPQNLVITPHLLEAARLLDTDLSFVIENTETAAKQLTEKYNCITVLKCHRTVVCDKNNLYINEHGNSALAKAGSGDVLAGIITGLLAQKMPYYEAAKLGVYLHSICGEIASKDLTEYSVLASDLIGYLPKAIVTLL